MPINSCLRGLSQQMQKWRGLPRLLMMENQLSANHHLLPHLPPAPLSKLFPELKILPLGGPPLKPSLDTQAPPFPAPLLSLPPNPFPPLWLSPPFANLAPL